MGSVTRGNVTGALMGDPGHKSAVVERLHPRVPAMPIARAAVDPSPPPTPSAPEVAAAEPVQISSAVRPVEPLGFDEPLTLHPIPTDKPGIEWLKPTELLVDETYQRNLSDKSRALIRKIAEHFDWRRYKPPIVAWTERGYEIVDGQHTALGAAMRSDIETIPVQIILALDIEERASAFVGHNTDRLVVTPMQLHRAKVVGKDPDAEMIDRVCELAGVHLVESYHGEYKWKGGDTIAVGAIDAAIKRRGPDQVVALLKVLVAAELPPIKADQIKAVEFLFSDPRYAERIEPLPAGGVDLAAAIKKAGVGVIQDAKLMARTEKIPAWKALALIWFNKTNKRRAT